MTLVTQMTQIVSSPLLSYIQTKNQIYFIRQGKDGKQIQAVMTDICIKPVVPPTLDGQSQGFKK